jgi:hypothetical protein
MRKTRNALLGILTMMSDHTSIAGGYRVHGGLVFHIEPFLRFIGLPKASLSAGFGRPHQAAREE